MDIPPIRRRAWIATSPANAYDLVADVSRMAEWSPNVVKVAYADNVGPRVGAVFTGVNKVGDRVWESTSRVLTAEPGKEFSWEVGDGVVRWTYSFHANTVVTVDWQVLKLLPAFGSTEEELRRFRRFTAKGIEDTLIALAEAQCTR
ncbi:SRPBCC family protein [Allokutzneria albata]|uniref:Polyketide cyclase / dehydrase and lipid transport n=1 Tax=Allokutzneria albata TaxID=211114 RepID=A0A1G9UJ65_ALLAB|nr:SRPBCC family protein [Allokutzneria albata]SDM59972.1 Polyketide cyclase / dehydrase and lipid transport [Allokutzneria albata]